MQEKTETDLELIQNKVNELLNIHNPYHLLSTEDALKKQLQLLNALHPTDMGKLSSRIALGCPANELQFYIQIVSNFLKNTSLDSDTDEELSASDDLEIGFCEILFKALEANRVIQKILDPNNLEPYQEFLDFEYNCGLLTAFRELSLKLLKGHELSVALQLASTTPEKQCKIVLDNLNAVFCSTLFAQQVKMVFGVRRDIRHFLLGNNPSAFFSNEQFKAETYLTCPELFDNFLQGEETKIGKKLANINAPDFFYVMTSRLDSLNTIASLKRISNAMYTKKEQMLTAKPNFNCKHPDSVHSVLFSNSELVRRKNHSNEENDIDSFETEDHLMNLELLEDEEPNICQKYCTLF